MRDNSSYIIAAFAITWLVLIAYTVRLQRLTRRFQAMVDEAASRAPGARGDQ
jgi:CcmD family protein